MNIIYNRTYLESSSRKHISISGKINARLKLERDRPRSKTLKEVQAQFLPQIEVIFKRFWEVTYIKLIIIIVIKYYFSIKLTLNIRTILFTKLC